MTKENLWQVIVGMVAALSTVTLNMGGFALIPLMIVFIDLLYADLKREKGALGRIPHGH